jgi:MFS transporter, PPP family, 3-phenylpropionic acid transporter
MTALQPPRTSRWVLVALYVASFVAAGAVAPYIAVYFQDLGLSLDGIGLLAAAIALCAVFGAPLWGALADQRLGARAVLVMSAFGAAAMAAIVGLTDSLVVAAVFAVLFSAATAGLDPTINVATLDVVGEQRSRFAFYRAWGSAAFVVAAIAVGVLIDATSLRAMFVPLVVSLVVVGLLGFGVPRRASSKAGRSLAGVGELLRQRPMAAFLLASLIVWGAAEMVNDFFPIYLNSLNAPSALVGSAFALSAVVEVPAMLLFPFLVRRTGLSRVIVIGAICFLLRTVVLLVSNDPYIATASMAINGLGSGLLLVSGITYVASLAPSNHATTAQGIFIAFFAGLAAALGPALAGIVADATSMQTMFVLAALISAVGIVTIALAVSWQGLAATSSQTPPDPAAESATDVPTTA